MASPFQNTNFTFWRSSLYILSYPLPYNPGANTGVILLTEWWCFSILLITDFIKIFQIVLQI